MWIVSFFNNWEIDRGLIMTETYRHNYWTVFFVGLIIAAVLAYIAYVIG